MQSGSVLQSIVTLLRRALGLFFLAFALLGFILPILPGWPFIIPAVLLLGRRDPALRRTHLLLRHTLRWLRRSDSPLLCKLGMRLSLEYVRSKRMLGPKIVAAERAFRLA